jgi:hypothetical protein
MWYDVFISYDPADRETAGAVGRALKREGLACWIAHRDRPSQAPTDESIDRAIRESRLVILILTAHAAVSERVLREVKVADAAFIPVLVFRAEGAGPSDELARFIEGRHSIKWTPPVEAHLPMLVMEVRRREELRQAEWRREQRRREALRWREERLREERRWLEELLRRAEQQRLEEKQRRWLEELLRQAEQQLEETKTNSTKSTNGADEGMSRGRLAHAPRGDPRRHSGDGQGRLVERGWRK